MQGDGVGFSCVKCVEKGRRGQYTPGIQAPALPERRGDSACPELGKKLTESSRSKCLWWVPADEETCWARAQMLLMQENLRRSKSLNDAARETEISRSVL